MSAPVDRDLVAHLLQDETLSFREIARQANCSDWSVRSIAKELNSDPLAGNGIEAESEPLTPRDWMIFGGILIAIFGGIWLLAGRLPPMDDPM